jgi:5,10-methylenetetrahydromethanopterin reductase
MASEINLGIGVLQDDPYDRLIEYAQWCESLGYAQFWYANEWFYRDMYVGLTLLAQHTERMRLGTYIADPYTRHPAMTAIAIASVDEVSGGRAMLLLGASGAGASPLAIPRVRPAKAIGEAIEIIRALLNGEHVDYDGEVLKFLGGAKLSFEARHDIPIYVASRGDRVLATAGAVADGVMVATHATPAGLKHGLSRVAIGAKRAGRRVEDLELFARVDGCISEDPRAAREAVRPMVARLLGSSYPDRSFVHALGLEVPPAFEEVAKHRDRLRTSAAVHLIQDDLLDAFTWAGTADQVAEKVAAVVDIGFRNLTLSPHALPGDRTEPSVQAFAEQVRPRVEALLRG